MNKFVGWVRAVDKAILTFVEESYLWLYDWTGVYVATIGAFVNLYFFMVTGRSWIMVALTAINLLLMGGLYLFQRMGDKIWNASAIRAEELFWSLRIGLFIMDMMGLVLDAVEHRPWHMIADALWALYGYLFCIKLRDRNKKEFKLPSLSPKYAESIGM